MPALALRRAVSCACLVLAPVAAHATYVDFDDIPWTPGPDEEVNWDWRPVTDEYAALGLVVHDGWLARDETGNQYLLGGADFSIGFTGTLPRYVSFDLSSPSAPLEATAGVNGNPSAGSARTGGWYWGGPELGLVQDRPYQANTPASFASPGGIHGLGFYAFGSTKFTAIVDNVYFGAVAPVPEPASLVLAAAGLGVLLARRRRSG